MFRTARNTPSAANGGSVTFQPFEVDTTANKPGVGKQIAIGHANKDGILDICVASRIGLVVYLGK